MCRHAAVRESAKRGTSLPFRGMQYGNNGMATGNAGGNGGNGLPGNRLAPSRTSQWKYGTMCFFEVRHYFKSGKHDFVNAGLSFDRIRVYLIRESVKYTL